MERGKDRAENQSIHWATGTGNLHQKDSKGIIMGLVEFWCIVYNIEQPPLTDFLQPEISLSGEKWWHHLPYEIRAEWIKTILQGGVSLPDKGWFPRAPLLLWQHPWTHPAPPSPSIIGMCFQQISTQNLLATFLLPFTKMSIIQEAFLDPPCKINVAHSVLPLSALFFIASIAPKLTTLFVNLS